MFLCLCALVSVFSVVASFRFAEKQREKIYVLDGGKSLMLALSQDLSQNRPVEAREHIRRFHELFFTLSPDRAAIESNINRALFLDFEEVRKNSAWSMKNSLRLLIMSCLLIYTAIRRFGKSMPTAAWFLNWRVRLSAMK